MKLHRTWWRHGTSRRRHYANVLTKSEKARAEYLRLMAVKLSLHLTSAIQSTKNCKRTRTNTLAVLIFYCEEPKDGLLWFFSTIED